MRIKDLKIIKFISSFLLLSFITTFVFNNYSYALTTQDLSSLTDLRKESGYDRSFSHIGLKEESAINQSATQFVDTMNGLYDEQKGRIQKNLESAKGRIQATADSRVGDIKKATELSKNQLLDNFKQNLNNYKANYPNQKANLYSTYNTKIQQINRISARLQAILNKKSKDISSTKAEIIVANTVAKSAKFLMQTVGLGGKIADINVNKSGDVTNNNDIYKQLSNLREKKIQLDTTLKQSIASLDARYAETIKNMTISRDNQIASLIQKNDSYISSAINFTNNQIASLDSENQKKIDEIHSVSKSQIQDYLFGDKGVYKKAYDYENDSVMKNLSADQNDKNPEIKTDQSTSGYIGDLTEYQAIEEQRRVYFGNQYLEKADKILSSGASDGLSSASEFTAASGVVGKNAEVLMPKDFADSAQLKGQIDLNMQEGTPAGAVSDNFVLNQNDYLSNSEKELLDSADDIINSTNKMVSDIENSLSNSTKIATNDIYNFTANTLSINNSELVKELKALLDFVNNKLNKSMDMVWPEQGGGEYERATEARQKAYDFQEAAKNNDGFPWLIIGLALAIVGSAATIKIGYNMVVAGLFMLAGGAIPCGIASIIGGTLLVASGAVALYFAINGLIGAISDYEALLSANAKASQNQQNIATAFGELTKPPDKETPPIPTEYTIYQDAEKNLSGAKGAFAQQLALAFNNDSYLEIRKRIKAVNKFLQGRSIEGLSEKDLLELQNKLFYFKNASNHIGLNRSMENLKNANDAYQVALENFKNSKKTITYVITDLDEKGRWKEFEKTKKLYEAYQEMIFWGEVSRNLQDAIDNAYVFVKKKDGSIGTKYMGIGSEANPEYMTVEYQDQDGVWRTKKVVKWDGFANGQAQWFRESVERPFMNHFQKRIDEMNEHIGRRSEFAKNMHIDGDWKFLEIFGVDANLIRDSLNFITEGFAWIGADATGEFSKFWINFGKAYASTVFMPYSMVVGSSQNFSNGNVYFNVDEFAKLKTDELFNFNDGFTGFWTSGIMGAFFNKNGWTEFFGTGIMGAFRKTAIGILSMPTGFIEGIVGIRSGTLNNMIERELGVTKIDITKRMEYNRQTKQYEYADDYIGTKYMDWGTALGNLAEMIVTAGTDGIKNFGESIGETLSSIKDFFKKITSAEFWNNIGSSISDAFSSTVKFFKEFGEVAGKFFKDAGNKLGSFVKTVKNSLSSFASTVKDFFSDPRKVIGDYFSAKIGKSIADGIDFSDSIKPVKPSLWARIQNFFSDTKKVIGDYFSAKIGKSIADGIDFSDSVKVSKPSFLSKIWNSDIMKSVRNYSDKIWNSDIVKDVRNYVYEKWAGFRDIFDPEENKFNDVKNYVSSSIDSLVDPKGKYSRLNTVLKVVASLLAPVAYVSLAILKATGITEIFYGKKKFNPLTGKFDTPYLDANKNVVNKGFFADWDNINQRHAKGDIGLAKSLGEKTMLILNLGVDIAGAIMNTALTIGTIAVFMSNPFLAVGLQFGTYLYNEYVLGKRAERSRQERADEDAIKENLKKSATNPYIEDGPNRVEDVSIVGNIENLAESRGISIIGDESGQRLSLAEFTSKVLSGELVSQDAGIGIQIKNTKLILAGNVVDALVNRYVSSSSNETLQILRTDLYENLRRSTTEEQRKTIGDSLNKLSTESLNRMSIEEVKGLVNSLKQTNSLSGQKELDIQIKEIQRLTELSQQESTTNNPQKSATIKQQLADLYKTLGSTELSFNDGKIKKMTFDDLSAKLGVDFVSEIVAKNTGGSDITTAINDILKARTGIVKELLLARLTLSDFEKSTQNIAKSLAKSNQSLSDVTSETVKTLEKSLKDVKGDNAADVEIQKKAIQSLIDNIKKGNLADLLKEPKLKLSPEAIELVNKVIDEQKSYVKNASDAILAVVKQRSIDEISETLTKKLSTAETDREKIAIELLIDRVKSGDPEILKKLSEKIDLEPMRLLDEATKTALQESLKILADTSIEQQKNMKVSLETLDAETVKKILEGKTAELSHTAKKIILDLKNKGIALENVKDALDVLKKETDTGMLGTYYDRMQSLATRIELVSEETAKELKKELAEVKKVVENLKLLKVSENTLFVNMLDKLQPAEIKAKAKELDIKEEVLDTLFKIKTVSDFEGKGTDAQKKAYQEAKAKELGIEVKDLQVLANIQKKLGGNKTIFEMLKYGESLPEYTASRILNKINENIKKVGEAILVKAQAQQEAEFAKNLQIGVEQNAKWIEKIAKGEIEASDRIELEDMKKQIDDELAYQQKYLASNSPEAQKAKLAIEDTISKLKQKKTAIDDLLKPSIKTLSIEERQLLAERIVIASTEFNRVESLQAKVESIKSRLAQFESLQKQIDLKKANPLTPEIQIEIKRLIDEQNKILNNGANDQIKFISTQIDNLTKLIELQNRKLEYETKKVDTSIITKAIEEITAKIGVFNTNDAKNKLNELDQKKSELTRSLTTRDELLSVQKNLEQQITIELGGSAEVYRIKIAELNKQKLDSPFNKILYEKINKQITDLEYEYENIVIKPYLARNAEIQRTIIEHLSLENLASSRTVIEFLTGQNKFNSFSQRIAENIAIRANTKDIAGFSNFEYQIAGIKVNLTDAGILRFVKDNFSDLDLGQRSWRTLFIKKGYIEIYTQKQEENKKKLSENADALSFLKEGKNRIESSASKIEALLDDQMGYTTLEDTELEALLKTGNPEKIAEAIANGKKEAKTKKGGTIFSNFEDLEVTKTDLSATDPASGKLTKEATEKKRQIEKRVTKIKERVTELEKQIKESKGTNKKILQEQVKHLENLKDYYQTVLDGGDTLYAATGVVREYLKVSGSEGLNFLMQDLEIKYKQSKINNTAKIAGLITGLEGKLSIESDYVRKKIIQSQIDILEREKLIYQKAYALDDLINQHATYQSNGKAPIIFNKEKRKAEEYLEKDLDRLLKIVKMERPNGTISVLKETNPGEGVIEIALDKLRKQLISDPSREAIIKSAEYGEVETNVLKRVIPEADLQRYQELTAKISSKKTLEGQEATDFREINFKILNKMTPDLVREIAVAKGMSEVEFYMQKSISTDFVKKAMESIDQVDPMYQTLNKIYALKQMEYLKQSADVIFNVQKANRAVNKMGDMRDRDVVLAIQKGGDDVEELKRAYSDENSPADYELAKRFIKEFNDGKIKSVEALDLYVARVKKALMREIMIANKYGKQESVEIQAKVKNLAEISEHLNRRVNESSDEYFQILNREHDVALAKMYALLKEKSNKTNAEISTMEFPEINKLLEKMNSEDILQELFGVKENLTQLQSDVYRVVVLKMIEGFRKGGDSTTVSASAITNTHLNMIQTRNQLLMMKANDAGLIAALGMGGGKTRVYPIVIGSDFLMGKTDNYLGQVYVSAKQEINGAMDNAEFMQKFYDVEIINGVELHKKGELVDKLVKAKLNKIKTIAIFDIETRNHMAHEMRTKKELKIVCDISDTKIDEADALFLKQQQAIVATRIKADEYLNVLSGKIFQLYDKLSADNEQNPEQTLGRYRYNESTGELDFDEPLVRGMLDALRNEPEIKKALFDPNRWFALSNEEVDGQVSSIIQQVLRAKAEIESGGTTGGSKTDTVAGIQYGVKDGDIYNSVASQIYEPFYRQKAKGEKFTIEGFEKKMGVKINKFKTEVSKTTAEASIQEVLTTNPGIRPLIAGGSGTTYGAKRISEAISSKVAELAEASWSDFAFETTVAKGKQSSYASDFGNRIMDMDIIKLKSEKLESEKLERAKLERAKLENWGGAIFQKQSSLRENILETLRTKQQNLKEGQKAQGDALGKLIENIERITDGRNRISRVEITDTALDATYVDSVFAPKIKGEKYRSLEALLESGEIIYKNGNFVTAEKLRPVEVSLMDILKSEKACKEIAIADKAAQLDATVLEKLQRIDVVDDYTATSEVNEIAKATAINGNIIYSTAKSGRGMNFQYQMQILVLDAESIPRNILLQMLGRGGRAKARVYREVVINPSTLTPKFKEQIEVLDQKLILLNKVKNTNNQELMADIKQQKIEIEAQKAELVGYIADIANGNLKNSASDMIKLNSQILGEQKSNGSSLAKIGDDVRTSLFKIPLEQMMLRATPEDRKVIQAVIDEVVRKNRGATADLIKAQDAGWKGPEDIFYEIMKNNLDQAIQIFDILVSKKFIAAGMQRKRLLGDSRGIEGEELRAEIKARIRDLKKTKANLENIHKQDWQEVRFEAKKRAEKGEMTTLSEVNSMDSAYIGSKVLETATFLATELSPQRKSVKVSDFAQTRSVKIVNEAITGNILTSAVRFDEKVTAGTRITSAMQNIQKTGQRIGVIFLTSQQYRIIQKDPVALRQFQALANSQDWSQGLLRTGSIEIKIADTDEDITTGNVKIYKDGKVQNIATAETTEFRTSLITLDTKQIILGTHVLNDDSKEEELQRLFEEQIRSITFGIDPDILKKSDRLVIKIDAKRYESMKDEDKKRLEEIIKTRKANGADTIVVKVNTLDVTAESSATDLREMSNSGQINPQVYIQLTENERLATEKKKKATIDQSLASKETREKEIREIDRQLKSIQEAILSIPIKDNKTTAQKKIYLEELKKLKNFTEESLESRMQELAQIKANLQTAEEDSNEKIMLIAQEKSFTNQVEELRKNSQVITDQLSEITPKIDLQSTKETLLKRRKSVEAEVVALEKNTEDTLLKLDQAFASKQKELTVKKLQAQISEDISRLETEKITISTPERTRLETRLNSNLKIFTAITQEAPLASATPLVRRQEILALNTSISSLRDELAKASKAETEIAKKEKDLKELEQKKSTTAPSELAKLEKDIKDAKKELDEYKSQALVQDTIQAELAKLVATRNDKIKKIEKLSDLDTQIKKFSLGVVDRESRKKEVEQDLNKFKIILDQILKQKILDQMRKQKNEAILILSDLDSALAKEIVTFRSNIDQMKKDSQPQEEITAEEARLAEATTQRLEVAKALISYDKNNELTVIRQAIADANEIVAGDAVDIQSNENLELLFSTEQSVISSYQRLEQARRQAIFKGELEEASLIAPLSSDGETLNLAKTYLYKQVKSRLKKDPSQEEGYVDLLSRQVEKMLEQGKSVEQIVVSADSSETVNIQDVAVRAIAKGIERFNQKSARFVNTKLKESKMKSITVVNTKGIQVDYYVFENGHWASKKKGLEDTMKGESAKKSSQMPNIPGMTLAQMKQFGLGGGDEIKVIKQEEESLGFVSTLERPFNWAKDATSWFTNWVTNKVKLFKNKIGFSTAYNWFNNLGTGWKILVGIVGTATFIIPAILVVHMIGYMVYAGLVAIGWIGLWLPLQSVFLIGASVLAGWNKLFGNKMNFVEDFKKQILKDLRAQKSKDEPVIIDLGDINDEQKVDEIVVDVLKAIIEEKDLPRNIVFKNKGIYFGATKGNVREYLQKWRTTESKNIAGILTLDSKIESLADSITPTLEDIQEEALDAKKTKEQIEAKYESLGLNNDKTVRLYFDGKITQQDGSQKELFTIERTDKKIIIKVKKDKDMLALLANQENLNKFLQGLRQLELSDRDLGKDMEIILPEIDQKDETQVTNREKIKNTAELFISEMDQVSDVNKRKFLLLNYQGNILASNENIAGSYLSTYPDKFKDKKALVVPDIMLLDKNVFKKWLTNMLLTDEMRELDEQQNHVILRLDTLGDLTEQELFDIQSVMFEFSGENITLTNRAGKIIFTNVDLTQKEKSPAVPEAEASVGVVEPAIALGDVAVALVEPAGASGAVQVDRSVSPSISAISSDSDEQAPLVKVAPLRSEAKYSPAPAPAPAPAQSGESFTLNTVRLNKKMREELVKKDLTNITTFVINQEFAQSPSEIMALIRLLDRQRFKGDIEVKGNDRKTVKLWREELFVNGAIIKDIDTKENFDTLVKTLKEKSKPTYYEKYSIVLNMKFKEKVSMRAIEKLIDSGVLGDVTITQGGQILATNNGQVKKLVEHYRVISGHTSELTELPASQANHQNEISEVIDFKAPASAGINFGNIGSAPISIQAGFNLPVLDGNIVVCLQGAQSAYQKYTASLATLNKDSAPSSLDIKTMTRDLSRAMYKLGMEYGLLSREKTGLPASIANNSLRYLDSAA